MVIPYERSDKNAWSDQLKKLANPVWLNGLIDGEAVQVSANEVR
jgi:hypothetical protein